MKLKSRRLDRNQRIFFLVASVAMFIGIFLSNWQEVHWLLYLMAAMFLGAAAKGYCTMMVIVDQIFRRK